MIIQQLELTNFGVYEQQTFCLTPQPLNGYNRPVVLLRGKNGTGKTTLLEAVRLCLHGSFVLGNRVSRSAYEDYLARRIHMPSDPEGRPTTAKLSMLLDHVSDGQKRTYRVDREWSLVRTKVKERVHIWEDGAELVDLVDNEQKDSFLRELVSTGLADLFFFDGEKLQDLAESEASSELLSSTVGALLGLNLVDQLRKDLDVYLARHGANGQSPLQQQFCELGERISALERKRLELHMDQRDNREAIAKRRRAIAGQEQRIASEGQWFADRLDDLKSQRQRLELTIEIQRRRAQELANGLLPFAIAPEMCQCVADRLQMEATYERGVAAQHILEKQIEQVADDIALPSFWDEVGIRADDETKQRVFLKLTSSLRQAIPSPTIDSQEVIHQLSEQDRHKLLNWIEQSKRTVPQALCQIVGSLDAMEEELEQIDREMMLVPADETLGPLAETLQKHNQELGALQKTRQNLAEQIRSLDYELEQWGYQQQRIRHQLVEAEQNNQKIQLVDKTRLVLEEYAAKLRQEKLSLLQERLAVRFNDLCRKKDLVDAARIDPETFEITLYRQHQSFEFEQLSAGERQLLSMAIMWALREVSGVPTPIIVDTPLGRLDSDHRISVIRNYFPRVSHQVILLATDTEVDDRLLSELTPAISRTYHLNYDARKGKTVVHEGPPDDIPIHERVITE